MSFGYFSTFQLIDKGNIEVFGPAGAAFNLQSFSKGFSSIQSGLLSNYALTFGLVSLLVIAFFVLKLLGLSSSVGDEVLIVLVFSYLATNFSS